MVEFIEVMAIITDNHHRVPSAGRERTPMLINEEDIATVQLSDWYWEAANPRARWTGVKLMLRAGTIYYIDHSYSEISRVLAGALTPAEQNSRPLRTVRIRANEHS